MLRFRTGLNYGWRYTPDYSPKKSKNENFDGWQAWKEMNKAGFDCTVHFQREGNKITVTTENGGIVIKSVTTIIKEAPEVYAALTGDQCVITNIRIK